MTLIRPLTRDLVFWLAIAAATLASEMPVWGAWHEFSPPGSSGGSGILEEVLSRSGKPQYFRQKYASDLATMCHEATHIVNGEASKQFGPREAFYVGEGVVCVLPSPSVRMKDIAARIPTNYRDGCYYQLYFVTQPSTQPILNAMPLYVMDEWSSAINGAQAARELGVSDTGDLQMSNQFCFFADAMLSTIRQLDPGYQGMAELEELVQFQKKRVLWLNSLNQQRPLARATPQSTMTLNGQQLRGAEQSSWRADRLSGATTQAKPMQSCIDCNRYGGGWQPAQPSRRVVITPSQPRPRPTPTQPSFDADKIKTDILVEVTGLIEAAKCQCGDKDYATNADLQSLAAEVDVLASSTAQLSQSVQSIADANASITNTINNLPEPYQPPTPEELAEKIGPHLTHSATIRLLDGTPKIQTKPLSEPLEFIQHSVSVKQ